MKISIPKIGLGTYLLKDKGLVACIPEALKSGYSHIDTAQVYAYIKSYI